MLSVQIQVAPDIQEQ